MHLVFTIILNSGHYIDASPSLLFLLQKLDKVKYNIYYYSDVLCFHHTE